MATINKKITLSLFLSAIICTGSIQPRTAEISATAISSSYEGNEAAFKYLEYLFIEQPANALKGYSQKALAAALTVVTTSILSRPYWAQAPVQKIEVGIETISAALLGSVVYQMYISQVDKSIKKATLIKFLENWNHHRQHVPTQLVPVFNELANAFNRSSKAITQAHVDQIFEIIQHLIEHEFAKRYEKDKTKSADTLGMLKTITEINKNLAPSSK